MNKTPFQNFIKELEKKEMKESELYQLAKDMQKLEKTFINGVYDTGHFDGEMKRSKKNYYDYKFECYLKTINR